MSGGCGIDVNRLTHFFLNHSHLITSTIIKVVGKKLEFANRFGLCQVHGPKWVNMHKILTI